MPAAEWPLVLASASPRRRALLEAAGFDFEVKAVDVDESRRAGEPAGEYVERMAREKATAGARARPESTVIGADTIVAVDGDVLGKPADDGEALRMLRMLSGRSHEVRSSPMISAATRLPPAGQLGLLRVPMCVGSLAGASSPR